LDTPHLLDNKHSASLQSRDKVEVYTLGGKKYTDESHWPVVRIMPELLYDSTLELNERLINLWPIMLYLEEGWLGDSMKFYAGLILRPVGGNQYERLGVIQYMDVYPEPGQLCTTSGTEVIDQAYLETVTGYEKRSMRLV
jgi:hypothetical protein